VTPDNGDTPKQSRRGNQGNDMTARTHFNSLSTARRYLARLDRAVYVDVLDVQIYSHDEPISVEVCVGFQREYRVTRGRDGKISQKFTGWAS
jgi:hypothetical protein